MYRKRRNLYIRCSVNWCVELFEQGLADDLFMSSNEMIALSKITQWCNCQLSGSLFIYSFVVFGGLGSLALFLKQDCFKTILLQDNKCHDDKRIL